MATYGRLLVRARYLVVVLWLVLVPVLLFWVPDEPDDPVSGLQDVIPTDLPAIQGQVEAIEEFGFPVLARQAVVQRDPEGLALGTHVDAVLEAAVVTRFGGGSGLENVAGVLPVTNAGGVLPSSTESGTSTVSYLFFRPDVPQGVRVVESERYGQRLAESDPQSFVGVTGAVAGQEAQSTILRDWIVPLQVVSIGVIVIVVALAVRSVVAPLVALATAGLAFLVSGRVGVQLGNLTDIAEPTALEPVVIVLLVGVVTDYFVILALGFRRGLEAGMDGRAAAVATVERNGWAIVMATLTTAGGTLALLAARFELYAGLGPRLAVAVLSAGLVAVTFAPAALAIVGRRAVAHLALRQRVEAGEVRREGRRRVAKVRQVAIRVVTTRPVAALLSVLVVTALGAIFLESPQVRVGANLLSELPASTEARRAAEEAGEAFAPGIVAPTELLVTGTGLDEQLPRLAVVEARIEALPGVAGVIGPAEQPTPLDLGLVRAPSGNAVRFIVIFDDLPFGASAIESLGEVEEEATTALSAVGVDANAIAVGDTAIAAALIDLSQGDLLRVALVTALIDLVLLAVFLRSLVAPLLVLAAGASVVVAALALVGAVTPTLLGGDSFTFFVPIAALVLLVGFVTDYHVLLVGSVWNETRSTGLRAAIIRAEHRVAGTIASAGMALAASFAALAVVPLVSFRQMAIALVVGIVLDVVVVRLVVMPAGLAALGSWAAWPNRRLMSRFDDAAPERPQPSDVDVTGEGDAGGSGASPNPDLEGRDSAS